MHGEIKWKASYYGSFYAGNTGLNPVGTAK